MAPRSYHLSSLSEELSYSGRRWWDSEGPPVSKYHGAWAMYSKGKYVSQMARQATKMVNVRGMWGLMAFPSSSRAAGAVPAFLAASRSFCLRNSSRDNFPGPASQIKVTKLAPSLFYVPVPEAMMARVKDRLTKPGNKIILKSHHVPSPERVLARSSTTIRC